jgi:hypothetical protein
MSEMDEWDLILAELQPDLITPSEEPVKEENEDSEDKEFKLNPDTLKKLEDLENLEAAMAKVAIEPVYLTIGISLTDGITVSTDGEDEVLLISLLASLLRGDLDDLILASAPKYKVLFPDWGDEAPLIYPDKTLWENTNEPE